MYEYVIQYVYKPILLGILFMIILQKYKRYMGSTSEKGIIKTAKTGRRRWCTAVDLYFGQVQKVHG
jgi:hypothetical protein